MSNIKAKTIKQGLKALLGATAAGVALMAMATPAGAVTAVYLDKDEMFNPVTVALLNNPGNHYPTGNVLAGPVLFTANLGTTASSNTFQFLGFCVDIFDQVSVGVNSPAALNQAYETDSLTDNNGSGSTLHAIDAATLNKINILVTYGTSLWNTDSFTDPTHNISSALANQLAAIQGAIWEIENPGLNVDGPSAVDSLITTYEGANFFTDHAAGSMTVIVDSGGNPLHQSFAISTPNQLTTLTTVPEPATWGLMILGFGGVGAMLRRRRPAGALATA